MPNRLQPRPAPADEIITLLRRPKSGFVVYPKYIPTRMVDGRARFMTKCDMLVGPCACGYTHNEQDGWVRETLQYQNLRFEPLILWGEKQQRGMVVEIPAYWKEQRDWNRSRCDVLVGQCTCGRIHSIQENWVREQLRKHGAVILNLPQPEGADISEPTSASPTIGQSVTVRQAEDRIQRNGRTRGVPTNALNHWWVDDDEYSNGNPVPSLDMTPYMNMDLPIELQERVDNAEGAMDSCNCTTCESRREAERERVLQEWVQAAQRIRDTLDATDSDAWARDNCNERGQAPLFCDCEECCNTRLRSRNTQAERMPQSIDNRLARRDEIGDERGVMSIANAQAMQRVIRSAPYIGPDSE